MKDVQQIPKYHSVMWYELVTIIMFYLYYKLNIDFIMMKIIIYFLYRYFGGCYDNYNDSIHKVYIMPNKKWVDCNVLKRFLQWHVTLFEIIVRRNLVSEVSLLLFLPAGTHLCDNESLCSLDTQESIVWINNEMYEEIIFTNHPNTVALVMAFNHQNVPLLGLLM